MSRRDTSGGTGRGSAFRRSRTLAGCTAVAAALALATPAAQAVISPGEVSTEAAAPEFVDVRAGDVVAPTAEQEAAVAELVKSSGAEVQWDDRFGTPRTILAYGEWLTEPREGDAVDVARAFVGDNRVALGLSQADVDALAVTGDHELPGTGTRTINLAQTFDGVQTARGGSMTVAVTDDGRVLNYTGATVRGGELSGGWEMDAAGALTSVAGVLAEGTDLTAKATGEKAGYQVFDKGPFAAESYVQKTAFPTADGVVPAYRVLFVEALDEAWDVVVDARSGDELYRSSLVQHEGEGTVYENFPGAEGGGQPVIKSFGPNEQSPAGYLDPTGLAGVAGPTTFGNNANTYSNYSNYLVPADQGPRPVSPTGQFNYSYAQNWQRSNGATVPPSYLGDMEAASTNLFWHHNRVHDEFYELGFTESAGNFQVNNNGESGQGGDPILGLVHAGAVSGGAPTYTGRDNAYMLTLPDGIPPWSGMFLWEPINDAFEGPYSDGNFDAGVIEHEYAHGLSNRYVSAEDGALNSHQSGSMGEGWGDWYAMNYLAREGLANDSVVGEYVTGNPERGIRNWAYDANPTGFGDIGYDLGGPEVHSDGEIWTAILWDMRKDLVEQYGEAEGGEIAARLVTDAMPLSPMDPSFLDMRDALVKAMDNRYHARPDFAALADTVYAAFAQRGAGVGASTEGGNDTDPTPAFDHRNPALNGSLAGRIVNASNGKAVEGARVILGEYEARVTPVTTTGADGTFGVPVTSGSYPVTISAPGFGSHTFDVAEVAAGQTLAQKYSLAPNLASTSNGAKVVSSTSPNAAALLDDTEASSWKAGKGGNVVVELAQQATVSSVQVSAYTTSRFEGLKSFTLQTSTDGVNWSTARSGEAFDYQEPRPTAPDLHYRTFELATPTQAKFVRFWTDEALGETKTAVQAAEMQVFAGDARKVEPVPPEPPDKPVTDEGTIVAGNPTGDVAQGVTGAEFANSCLMPPASQGADGWVTELPDSFGDGKHAVEVKGTSLAGTHDLDMYFYDAGCALVGRAASSAADESGALPSGTKYVLSQLWLGANVAIVLTATDTA